MPLAPFRSRRQPQIDEAPVRISGRGEGGGVSGAGADDARAMLTRLRQPHDVRTEIAIVGANGRRMRFAVRSHVRLDPSDREIDDYVASGEPLDKAGGMPSRVRAAVSSRSGPDAWRTSSGYRSAACTSRCGAWVSRPASARKLSARAGSRSGARSGGPFIVKATHCATEPNTAPGPTRSTDRRLGDQAASRRGSSDARAPSASRSNAVLVGVS
jgi:hypothetical protein